MFTVNTLLGLNIILCVFIIVCVFFCFYGILELKEKINTHIKQNQANQQKILNRIDEYRIRIDNLESLLEKKSDNKSVVDPVVIDEQTKTA